MNQYWKGTGGLLTKSVEDELTQRKVSGFYTGDNVDMYGHMIDPEGMLGAIVDYKSWGTIKEMHDSAVGVAESIGVPQWNYMTARISNSARGEEVLNLVRDGVYRAFSVGIIVTKAEYINSAEVSADKFVGLPENIASLILDMGEILVLREMALVEVSIVDRPANPLARVQSIQKNLAGGSLNVMPAIYELNKSADIGVIVNPQQSMVVTADMKNALGSDGSAVSPTENTKQEVVVEKDTTQEAIVEESIEAVAPNAEIETEDKSVEGAVEVPAEDDVVVEVEIDEADEADESDEDDVVEAEDEAAADAEVNPVEKALNELTEKVSALSELVSQLMSSADDEGDVESETAVVENGIDPEFVGAMADAIVERMKVTVKEKRERRSTISDVSADTPEDEVVDTRTLNARELSKLIAASAAKRI